MSSVPKLTEPAEALSVRKPVLAILASLVVLITLHFLVQGVYQLGYKPPVYHDEFVVAEGSRGVLTSGLPTTRFHNSNEDLEEILRGKGRLIITLGAGFHYLFALWVSVLGPSSLVARLFPSICSLVFALLLFRLGTLLFRSGWVGFFAALWWILDSSVTQAARQLRPDIPTALAFLSACWILWEFGQTKRGSLFLAGIITGLGMTMHPVGMIWLPGLALSFYYSGAWSRWRGRGLAVFVLGASFLLAPYAFYLFLNKSDLLTMIGLNAIQRPIPKLNYFHHLLELFKGAYPNAYQLKIGFFQNALYLIAFIVFFILALGKENKSNPGLKCSVFSSAACVLLVPFLARDYFNFLYLVHVWPWIFILGAGFVVRCVQRKLALAGLVALYGILFFGIYATEAGEWARWKIAGYDDVIRPLGRRVENHSFVIGTPNGFPIVEAAESTFIHNKMYTQWLPDYERYPVKVERQGSHCLTYAFDQEVLSDLARTGKPVYFHLDMYDWAWNLYYPFGSRYANSYVELKEGLEGLFNLEAVSYSRQRGRIELWRYGRRAARPPHVFVEGRPVEFTESRSFEPESELKSVSLEPGEWYWLEMKIRSIDGAVAVVSLNGKAYEKYFDAAIPAPLDYVFRAAQSKLELGISNLMQKGRIVTESVRLKKIRFLESTKNSHDHR